MTQRTAKPTLVPSGILTDRERLWTAMRQLRTFTTQDLALSAKMDRRYATVLGEYTNSLVKAGILKKNEPPQKGLFALFELVLDLGVDAPRVRKDGTFVPENGQSRMWQAMKILKTFSVRDLVVHASLPDAPIVEASARLYCTWLVLGKYLKVYTGDENDVTRYRYIRNTGSKAPQILRVKQLFDPNTGEVVTGEALEHALNRGEG
ncbi:MAG: hypothetical protein RR014_00940 [Bilophila sp.]